MNQDEPTAADSKNEPLDQDPLAALLKKALAKPPTPQVLFLSGVQERIRKRTKGRYFGTRHQVFRDPVILLLAAALLIVLIGVLVFLVLDPLMASTGR